ncbi:MAG: hypothetical protein AAFV85_23075 [Cyanobacteria bacterium J06634_6]
MPQATQPISPPQAKNTIVRAALIATGQTSRPISGTFTLASSTAGGGVSTEGTAEDITVTLDAAISSIVEVGQPLEFISPAGTSVIARVRTRYGGSGTSLELSANESIPDGSTAVFPPVARIRQSADIAESVATTTFSSFDHAQSSVSIGEGSATGTFNGGYSFYDAFYQTVLHAKDNTQRLYVERELESPDSSVFSKGPILWGIVIGTGITSNAQDGSNVSGDITVAFDSINRIDPQT